MKLTLLTLTFLIYSTVFSQPYLSMGFTDKGANLGAGIVVRGIDVSAAYDMPMTRVDKPANLSFAVGKQFNLSDPEENHWTITGSAGFAQCKYKEFKDGNYARSVNEIKPIYIAEVGWNAHVGRISFVVKHCDRLYAGASMRVFFK